MSDKAIGSVGARTADIERSSPWENGHVEGFHSRLATSCSTGDLCDVERGQIIVEGGNTHKLKP